MTQAVESALAQPETAEVILVEDGSPDNSLEVCRALAERHPKVTLLRHPGGVNRGAAPSRNLGMKHGHFPYIAFLDADDFFLPHRFDVPGEIFASDPECDGVYEAVGLHFEDEAGEERWLASNMGHVRLTTLVRQVAPEDLFRVLIKGGSGHIHLNGLVIRRSLLERCGYMNEAIADTLHEDTDFVLKAAAVGRLLPGRIDTPSSVRRAHAGNRVSAPRPPEDIFHDKMRLRMATFRWCRQTRLQEPRQLAFRRALSDQVLMERDGKETAAARSGSSRKTARLLAWPLRYPEVLLEGYYWQELGSAAWGIIRKDLLKRET